MPGEAPLNADSSLGRSAARGTAWQVASYGASKVFTLAFTVVLARLLTPEEFGLVALALLLIAYLEVVTDLGVGQGLIFEAGDRRRRDQAVALAVVTAAVVAAGVALAAPLVGSFFDRPDVTPLVRVLALSLVLSGAAQVPDALLRRDLRFSRRLLTEVARTLVQGIVSVTLAAAGYGAWAIAWGYLAGQAARAVAGWWVVDYRPGRDVFRPDRAQLRSLLSFGAPAAGTAVLLTLVHDVDYLIVGRVRGAEDLGLYTLAFRIPQTVVVPVFWAISSVGFPVFARVRADPVRLRRGYVAWVQLQALYGVPAGLGLAVVAPSLIPALVGERWLGAVPVLQALGVYSAVRAFSSGSFDVLKGIGRPRLALGVAAAALAVAIPVLIVAAHHGIATVGWAQVGLSGALAVAVQVIGCRLVGVRAIELLRALRAPLAAGAAVVLVAGGVRAAVPGGHVVRLAAATAAGALAALVAVRLADRRLLPGLAGLAWGKPSGRGGAGAGGGEIAAEGPALQAAGRLFLPPGAPPVVATTTWSAGELPAADHVVMGLAPAIRATAASLPRAVARDRAARRFARRPPPPFTAAEVHRLAPAQWRGGRGRGRLRSMLLSGVLVEFHRGETVRPLDELVADARFSPGPAPLRLGPDGAVLLIGTHRDAGPAVLRVGQAGSPGDPSGTATALRRLESATVPLVPRLVAAGLTGHASWVVETRLAGRRPVRLSRGVLEDTASLCAQLPRPGGPPLQLLEARRELQEAGALGSGTEAQLDWVTDAVAGLPAVMGHGDLWAGNLLVHRGRLSGVIDWDGWHPAAIPGVDLLQLVAAGAPGERPWREPSFRRLATPYWEAMDVEVDDELLEALGVAWRLSVTAYALRRFPHLANDGEWREAARAQMLVLPA